MPAKTEVTTSTIPCDWEGCTRTFASERARNTHRIRAHIKNWDTTGNLKRKNKLRWPSDDPEARKRKYRETVARYRAMGLNAQGKPYKDNAISRGVRKFHGVSLAEKTAPTTMSTKGRANIAKGQKIRRKREKQQQLLNGAAAPVEVPTDNLGETARAIMLTAQVLRSVSLGLKL